MEIRIGQHTIGLNHPTYFIADIAANHDGSLERAKYLIRLAALLHDIGKVKTPDEILSKKGPLTHEEREIMELHSLDGALNLMEQTNITNLATLVAMEHHMKYDGTGYPRGLKGEQIPLAARIFAVVDVWDALISDRPYRKAWSKKESIEYIRDQTGAQFDSAAVQMFLDVLNDLPDFLGS